MMLLFNRDRSQGKVRAQQIPVKEFIFLLKKGLLQRYFSKNYPFYLKDMPTIFQCYYFFFRFHLHNCSILSIQY